MNNSDLCWMSAADLAAAIVRKKVSPDVTVLRASAAFEAAHPWAQRRPALG
jgi:hypothetical protein